MTEQRTACLAVTSGSDFSSAACAKLAAASIKTPNWAYLKLRIVEIFNHSPFTKGTSAPGRLATLPPVILPSHSGFRQMTFKIYFTAGSMNFHILFISLGRPLLVDWRLRSQSLCAKLAAECALSPMEIQAILFRNCRNFT